MRWKIAALVSVAALLIVLAGIVFYVGFSTRFGLRGSDPAAVVTEVKQLNQLVTVRYSIQRVVGITEPKQPFGAESILLMVQGESIAGVDLQSMRPRDIQYSGKRSVVVALPPARILNTFLDENHTKVWDRHITWWTPWVPYDPDLEHKARLAALDDVRSAALSMGILAQAQKNAECAIKALLGAVKIDATFETRAR